MTTYPIEQIYPTIWLVGQMGQYGTTEIEHRHT